MFPLFVLMLNSCCCSSIAGVCWLYLILLFVLQSWCFFTSIFSSINYIYIYFDRYIYMYNVLLLLLYFLLNVNKGFLTLNLTMYSLDSWKRTLSWWVQPNHQMSEILRRTWSLSHKEPNFVKFFRFFLNVRQNYFVDFPDLI